MPGFLRQRVYVDAHVLSFGVLIKCPIASPQAMPTLWALRGQECPRSRKNKKDLHFRIIYGIFIFATFLQRFCNGYGYPQLKLDELRL